MTDLQDKVCSRKELLNRIAALQRPIIFTNDVFDLLHRDHVNYLHQAASLGGSLIVAVNSDASARLLGKGSDHPLNKAEERAIVLAGLASVSLVIVFNERTPVELIKEVQPDLYVRGGDYQIETLEGNPGGAKLGRRRGGHSICGRLLDHLPGAAYPCWRGRTTTS